VAIMATIGAGALIGYLYSIMFDRFDTPEFVITPAACWASWMPSGQGSASMS
jgi:ribose/xylose/arabinose/galactoside ABC-type transport system permease subunit